MDSLSKFLAKYTAKTKAGRQIVKGFFASQQSAYIDYPAWSRG